MRQLWRNNGLSITLFTAFALILVGQTLTGWNVYNQDQQEHGEAAVALSGYLQTGSFIEVTFENWESEFLQMAAYVFLTVFLYQRGSVESKDPDASEPADDDPATHRTDPNAPWPVRRGGVTLWLYEHSLGLAFVLLFLMAFTLHALGGANQYSQEQVAHGGSRVSTIAYLGTAQFWYESLQNWQSEFLAVGTIVVLTIFLRQRGSPESKPVAAPHSQTGG